jgi:hypothetical protein
MVAPKYPEKRFGPLVKIPMEILQAHENVAGSLAKWAAKKNTTTGYTLDPGQRAALEKKFNRSWHQTFTSLGSSLFDSFKGPGKGPKK